MAKRRFELVPNVLEEWNLVDWKDSEKRGIPKARYPIDKIPRNVVRAYLAELETLKEELRPEDIRLIFSYAKKAVRLAAVYPAPIKPPKEERINGKG